MCILRWVVGTWKLVLCMQPSAYCFDTNNQANSASTTQISTQEIYTQPDLASKVSK